MFARSTTFRVAMNDGDGGGVGAASKAFKTPAKGSSRGGKENAMSVSRSGINALKTPLPASKQLDASGVKGKKTMTGLTPAPPKTVLRPANTQQRNVQEKDVSPRPSTLRKSARVPSHQIKATPAPSFVSMQDDSDVGPSQLEVKQKENEQALLQQKMEEEDYHESDWSDFEVEYAPPKETQQEIPWRPLEEDFPDFPDFRELGTQMRKAPPVFGVYESDDEGYASDEVKQLQRAGGLEEKVSLDYDSDWSDGFGLSVKEEPEKEKKTVKKVVKKVSTKASKPAAPPRKPLLAQKGTAAPAKIKLDDLRVDIPLESCLLAE